MWRPRPHALAPAPPPPQVNLALSALPTFSCLPEQRGQHRTTTHLLPPEPGVLAAVQQVRGGWVNG